eukprot:6390402-Ditylum_brightwellii.AAC.1
MQDAGQATRMSINYPPKSCKVDKNMHTCPVGLTTSGANPGYVCLNPVFEKIQAYPVMAYNFKPLLRKD